MCVCVCVVSIGILRCDWQLRSLLGEIVNRAEPVICSRQPWKGTPDSQGSYWEFQRCLDWFGPGPASHRASERRSFSNPRWSMRSYVLPRCLRVSCCRTFSLLHFFKHLEPLFVSTLPTLHLSTLVSAVLHFFFFFFVKRQKLQFYWTQLNRHNWVNKENQSSRTFATASLKANNAGWFAYTVLPILVLAAWIFDAFFVYVACEH